MRLFLPDGLVGNDDLGPILLGQLGSDGVQLLGDNIDSLASFTLLNRVIACEIGLDIKSTERGITSRLSPMQRITLRPPSIAAFVLLETN